MPLCFDSSLLLRFHASLLTTSFQVLGVFHVLTGPDHLSALATLSANVGSVQAFFLGVRWGLGHSTGLVVVAVVLIVVTIGSSDETIEVPKGVSTFFESLVGVFMLLLGAYGLRKALVKRPYDDYGSLLPTDRDELQASSSHLEIHSFSQSGGHHGQSLDGALDSIFLQDEEKVEEDRRDEHEVVPVAVSQESFSSEDESRRICCPTCLKQATDRVSTGTMALSAGIIHGFAGPGGVLGVIPAVQLHSLRLASVYLGSFCLSSMVTMGLFATCYGTISSRLVRGTQRQTLIECISALLSLLVGILWLTLVSIGKLDDIFP